MNLLMAATPIAMAMCSHPFENTALVLEWHVLGMFVPSFFTGSLIKRFGALPVMAAGIVLNLLCIAVALSGVDLMHFTVALFTLGVGWNFLFIGGTTLVHEGLPARGKTTAQAAMDTVIFTTMTLTSFSSGALVTTQGWTWLNLGSIVPVLLIGGRCSGSRRAAPRQPAICGLAPCSRVATRRAPTDPATRSKRNSRHSIGPFHIGTRRDSFRRIALGSFMSGLSIQAVQPAGWLV